MRTSLRFAGIAALAAAAALGQGSDLRRGYPIRGDILPLPAGAGLMTIELSANDNGIPDSALVNADGSFEFRSVSPGPHELRVISTGGVVIHRETVVVNGPGQWLSIRVPQSFNASGTTSHSTDSTVSMRQLAHKVPPQARKAFEKGAEAERKGNHQQAAELFRQAVSLDPGFADAFNELGAVEALQGDLAQAIDDFQRAIDLVPDHRLALANLSIVLARARKFPEAADVARRALRVMPEAGSIRYVLAASLLLTSGDSDEVLDNLERSTTEVPVAHLLAAELLARRGRRDEAVQHVEQYLRVAPADDKQRGRAEAMLAQLKM
jgi:tetratricopeptide (TPR) repeat protein